MVSDMSLNAIAEKDLVAKNFKNYAFDRKNC